MENTVREVFQKSRFPWVTVCNESPLSDSVYPNLTWSYFFDIDERAKKFITQLPTVISNMFGVSDQM